MDRKRSHESPGISNTFNSAATSSASPLVTSAPSGPSNNDGDPSHPAPHRYSTLGSHPFASTHGVEENYEDASPLTEYFGQIDLDRPNARSYHKGKARAMNSDIMDETSARIGNGAGYQTNDVRSHSHPHMDARRREGPKGAMAIKTLTASGSSSANLFYQPESQLSATQEFEDTRTVFGVAQPIERTPRSANILEEQRTNLSGINTATYAGYASAIPLSAASRAQGLTVDTPASAFPTCLSYRPDHIRSKTASSSTSTASAYRRRDRIPSREILQAALDLAQKAVEYDGANDIPAALSMYRQAVSKLRSVMGRVGLQLEPISPDLGIPELSERENEDIAAAGKRRKAGTTSRSEEEGKTLKGIHDAYVARISLLRVMAGEEVSFRGSPVTHSPPSRRSASDVAPSPSIDHSGLSGIGNLMMNGFCASPIAKAESVDAFGYDEVVTGPPVLKQDGTVELNRMGDSIPHLQPPTISPRKASLNRNSVFAGGNTVSPSPSFASFDQGPSSRRPSAIFTNEHSAIDTSYEMISSTGISLRIPDPTFGTTSAAEPHITNSTSFRGSNLKISSQPPGEGQVPSISQPETEYDGSAAIPVALADSFQVTDNTTHSTGRMIAAQGSTAKLTSVGTSLSLVRAPFHLLRQLRQSMIASEGDYISPALFVPRVAWTQAGVKIPSMETKIRVMELLSQYLANMDTAGFVLEPTHSTGLKTLENTLEEFESLMEEVRRLLTKKLGDKVNFAKPRKSNSSTIGSWGSKFSKTFDKMGSSKSAGSLTAYVESLARLCLNAQVFDRYLETLNSISSSEFQPSQAPRIGQVVLEKRLNRISDFFGGVILAFVLQDLSLLLSKYLKQSSKWMEE